jgi:hypothetical protein
MDIVQLSEGPAANFSLDEALGAVAEHWQSERDIPLSTIFDGMFLEATHVIEDAGKEQDTDSPVFDSGPVEIPSESPEIGDPGD